MGFHNFKKGFTLIEILIALSIFSVVLMMTTSIVGQSAGFQSKIEAQKDTFQATRAISDMMATDIRSANIGGEIGADVNLDPSPILSRGLKNYTSGLAIFDCKMIGTDDKCLFVHFQDTDNGQESVMSNHVDAGLSQTTADYKGNTIVIEKKVPNTGNKQIVVYNLFAGDLYRFTFPSAASPAIPASASFELTDNLWQIRQDTNKINESALEIKEFKIGGYAPDEQGMLDFPLQPYVSYHLMIQSKNYETLLPVFRGQSEIVTTVTSRNY